MVLGESYFATQQFRYFSHMYLPVIRTVFPFTRSSYCVLPNGPSKIISLSRLSYSPTHTSLSNVIDTDLARVAP